VVVRRTTFEGNSGIGVYILGGVHGASARAELHEVRT